MCARVSRVSRVCPGSPRVCSLQERRMNSSRRRANLPIVATVITNSWHALRAPLPTAKWLSSGRQWAMPSRRARDDESSEEESSEEEEEEKRPRGKRSQQRSRRDRSSSSEDERPSKRRRSPDSNEGRNRRGRDDDDDEPLRRGRDDDDDEPRRRGRDDDDDEPRRPSNRGGGGSRGGGGGGAGRPRSPPPPAGKGGGRKADGAGPPPAARPPAPPRSGAQLASLISGANATHELLNIYQDYRDQLDARHVVQLWPRLAKRVTSENARATDRVHTWVVQHRVILGHLVSHCVKVHAH